MRRIWLVAFVIAAAVLEFASLRTGVGKGGRFPPESTSTALLVTVSSLIALGVVIAAGLWFKRRAQRNDRRLPFGITQYRRSRWP
jgi:hypothetical protein